MFNLVNEASNLDIEGLSGALGAEARPFQDVIWGNGYRFFLRDIPAELELYPEKMVVRYHTPAVYLAMSEVKIENGADDLRLTAEDANSRTVVSLFKAQGAISFTEPISEETAVPTVATVVKDAEVEVQIKSEPDAADNHTTEHRENPDRVTLTGNVGRDPEVRTTTKGRKVLKFPLGVHEGEKTNWYDILFFDEKAERVAAEIAKGKLVTVIGYRHEREAEVKKGNQTFKKKVTEIYGALARTPKAPAQRASK